MNETIQTILNRRSVRAYTGEEVRENELNAIVEAGTYAASGMNRQGWKFVAIQKEETLSRIVEQTCKELSLTASPYHKAKTLALVFTDSSSITPAEDASFAMANMMNAARSLGVGSCWIHASSIFFSTPAGKALQKELGIGDDFTCRAGAVFGYPAGEWPKALPRKEGIVHYLR